MLTDCQLKELEKLFLYEEIKKVGIITETGEVYVEYIDDFFVLRTKSIPQQTKK